MKKVYIKSRTTGITDEADRKDGEGERFVPGSREWKMQVTLSMVKKLFLLWDSCKPSRGDLQAFCFPLRGRENKIEESSSVRTGR